MTASSHVARFALASLVAASVTARADDERPAARCDSAIAYVGPALHAPPAPEAFPDAADSTELPLSPEVARRLDGAVAWILANTRAPGITAAIVAPGRGAWHTAKGLARTKPETPLAPEPLFYWASAGKAFTATIVLQLIDEGRIAYGDPLATWFPDFPNAKSITVDHLLTHTSGAFSFQEDLPFRRRKGYTAPDQLIAIAARHGSNFCPGERWLYSNTGYVLLARIIEAIEKRSYHEIVRARVIEPLALGRTTALAPRQSPPALATGHTDKVPDLDFDASTPHGAGVIVAPAGDMVRFWRAFLGGRLTRAATSRAAFDRLYPMFGQPGLFYGRGVMLAEFASGAGAHTWLMHSGGTPSAKAVVAYDATDRVFVAVAMNGDASAEAAAHLLLRALRGEDAMPPLR